MRAFSPEVLALVMERIACPEVRAILLVEVRKTSIAPKPSTPPAEQSATGEVSAATADGELSAAPKLEAPLQAHQTEIATSAPKQRSAKRPNGGTPARLPGTVSGGPGDEEREGGTVPMPPQQPDEKRAKVGAPATRQHELTLRALQDANMLATKAIDAMSAMAQAAVSRASSSHSPPRTSPRSSPVSGEENANGLVAFCPTSNQHLLSTCVLWSASAAVASIFEHKFGRILDHQRIYFAMSARLNGFDKPREIDTLIKILDEIPIDTERDTVYVRMHAHHLDTFDKAARQIHRAAMSSCAHVIVKTIWPVDNLVSDKRHAVLGRSWYKNDTLHCQNSHGQGFAVQVTRQSFQDAWWLDVTVRRRKPDPNTGEMEKAPPYLISDQWEQIKPQR
jgi:hypothetical protein